MAKISSAAKQYEDMLSYVRKLCRLMRAEFKTTDLTVEEKLYLRGSFHHVILVKRRQWRSIFNVYDTEERKQIIDDEDLGKKKDFKLGCILLMKKKIETEIRSLCKEAYIEIRFFLRNAVSLESRIFYLMMLADTFRYLAQVESGQTLIKLIKETDGRFLKAMEEAIQLEHTHPLKLALALNYSAFKYEVE